MSKPKYFQNFPNIQYALRANKAGKRENIEIKDYFNLLKVRDDIYREETIYSPYTIKNGQRPDQISYNYYGDEQFYWIILQINEITDYYNEWPLSEDELTEFVNKKYGGATGAGATRNWETMETFDNATPPNLLLEGGLVVPENYIFYYPSVPGSSITLSSKATSLSNYQYERRLNDRKSQIYLLDKKYIQGYESEVRNYAKNLDPLMSYVDLSTVSPSY
jgi:hypothetical protein